MNSNQEPASHLADAIEAFLDAKQKGNDSGNYRTLAENVLGRWNRWLQTRGIDDLERVDTQTMRRYAQYLRRRTRAKKSDDTSGGIAASTAQTYYAIISGFLT